ncbi:MAG: GNAT family N-acetyltransferase [Actinomycetes bacterium]
MSPAPSRVRAPGRADLEAIVGLLNACDIAETGRPDTTADDVAGDWELQGFELSKDAWIAETRDGLVVGYAYTGDQVRTGELEADVWVRPEHAEPELARRLLGLAERRARQLASGRGYAAPALDVFCVSTNAVKRELLRERGFALRRTVVRMAIDLEADLREPGPPAGVELREFRPGGDDRAMYETMMEAFADHYPESDEPFEAWRSRLLGHGAFDPDLWTLAWAGGEPVGGLIAYDHRDVGWLQGLGVRREWRRRGTGGALLAHAFSEFARRGRLRVELAVDAEGETRPLSVYERAGMRIAHAYELYEKPLAG